MCILDIFPCIGWCTVFSSVIFDLSYRHVKNCLNKCIKRLLIFQLIYLFCYHCFVGVIGIYVDCGKHAFWLLFCCGIFALDCVEAWIILFS